MSRRFSGRAWSLLALIMGIAILLRLWGIGYGLPELYHPDEGGYVRIAQRIFKTGDWNPHFFNYPSLFLYLNTLTYYPYYAANSVFGVFQSPADLPGPQLLTMGVGRTADPGSFLLGRVLTVIFGVGVVGLTALAGKRLFGYTTPALLGALFVAVSPTAVLNSRTITPDTFLLFFLMLALYASARVYREGRWAHYALAGVAVGLAASTKYNGVLIFTALLAAHFLRTGWRGWSDRKLYGAMVLSAIAFLLTTPYAVLDFPAFMAGVAYESEHYSSGHVGMDGDTLAWYLRYIWSTEGVIVLLGAIGVVRGLVVRSRPVMLLSVFPIVYFVFINGFVVRNDRTLLPVLPFAFLLGAHLLYEGWLWGTREVGAKRIVARSALGLLAVSSLLFSVGQMVGNTSLWLGGMQTRKEAGEWISANLKQGETVALESYSPYIDPARYTVMPFGTLILHDAAWYKAQGVDYLVFSSGMYGRYFNEPDRYGTEIEQYNQLFGALQEVKEFPDERFKVSIYRVNNTP